MNTKNLIISGLLVLIGAGVLMAQEPIRYEKSEGKSSISEITDIKARKVFEIQMNEAILMRIRGLQVAQAIDAKSKPEQIQKVTSVDEVWKEIEESIDSSLEQ